VARRLNSAFEELSGSCTFLKSLIEDDPRSDVDVFERIEQIGCLEQQQLISLQEAKEVLTQATDLNMNNECTKLGDICAAAKKCLKEAKDKLLVWRKQTGVWGDKKSRGAARADLKMPTFSASTGAKVTIYEFEREWREFCTAMEYSKEEALKNLRQALQQPVRGDVVSLKTETEIFDY